MMNSVQLLRRWRELTAGSRHSSSDSDTQFAKRCAHPADQSKTSSNVSSGPCRGVIALLDAHALRLHSSSPFAHTWFTSRRHPHHGRTESEERPGGDNNEPTNRDGGRSDAGRSGACRSDRDNRLSSRSGSRSSRCQQCPRAMALLRAVLVSGTVYLRVPALRAVAYIGWGASAFLARLVCRWPRLVEKRDSAGVRGVASSSPPVPAARRIRSLIRRSGLSRIRR